MIWIKSITVAILLNLICIGIYDNFDNTSHLLGVISGAILLKLNFDWSKND